MTCWVGVDPGQEGGFALLGPTGMLIAVQPMPVHDAEVSGLLVQALLHDWQTMMQDRLQVAIEQVHSMPGQGVSTTFKFGKNFGIVLGVVQGMGLPLHRITPQTWKKQFVLTGKDKDASRGKATEFWPGMADCWKRKKDNGLTDAALIAECARRTL